MQREVTRFAVFAESFSADGYVKRAAPRSLEDGAGEGNRTLVFSLEGCCSTIELHPLIWSTWVLQALCGRAFEPEKWRPLFLKTLRSLTGLLVEGTGFEPV